MSDNPVIHAVAQAGGLATWGQLRESVSARRIRSAVASGAVERVGYGRYALPGLAESRRLAARAGAVISHRSAALLHGWGVRREPSRPELMVPRGRTVPPSARRGAHVRWREFGSADVEEQGMTSPLRTVIDCARDLPLPEALAVADSALRAGDVRPSELRAARRDLLRVRRARVLTVLDAANAQAANPFESALRALTIEAVGPVFVPQRGVYLSDGTRVRPDLVAADLGIAIEADSHEFHTTRSRLRADCWRYAELSLSGWVVLRFAWEQVMCEEDWVRETVRRAVNLRSARAS